jgi:hypothetical protein
LELIGPEAKANIVGRRDSDGPSERGEIHGLSISGAVAIQIEVVRPESLFI